MILNICRAIYDTINHAFNPTFPNPISTCERKEIIDLVNKQKARYNHNKVDETFSDLIKDGLTKGKFSIVEIGKHDPYLHQCDETIYTDIIQIDTIMVYLSYRKVGNGRVREYVDIAFTRDNIKYYPSEETLNLFLDQYDEVKEYDRGFFG